MNKIVEKFINAVGNCKRSHTSKCILKSSYEIISDRFFFVFDDKDNDPEEPVKIVGDKDDYQLRVQNQDKKEICLIKTDNCLFNDDHQKCDCILISKDACFLVEISESRNRNGKRNDAVAQLSKTIEVLKDKEIDLSIFNSKAIICFKSKKTKPVQASFNTQRAVFLDQYHISLEEANMISF